jgi:DNA repair protein RadC
MLVKIAKVKVGMPSDTVQIFRDALAKADCTDREKEHFFCLGLDGAHRTKYLELVTLGLVDQTHVHPREVFSYSLEARCSAVIVCHNHPSGQLQPSQEDFDVTNRLKVAGEVLGVPVLDHIILADDGFYSFAEHGQL